MRHKLTMISAVIAAASLAFQAQAASVSFTLSGPGVSGTIDLTYAPNPNTGPVGSSSPNAFDPVGSYIVTGASGSFSDNNIGVSSTITGIVPSQPGNPTPGNLLAPHSFGFFPVASGIPTPEGVAPGFSYDNLFYPAGSPQAATDYPFSGGVFDIYGVVFTLLDGNAVNLWSNGDFGGGATYVVGVTNGLTVLDYVGDVSLTAAVPEPATWAMMIIGFGAVGAIMRTPRRRNAFAAA